MRTTEIRTRLSISKEENKQFHYSLQRLWRTCQVSRIDRPNKWGHHSFYIPSSMFDRREETRLAEGLFGSTMCYLEDLCQSRPFDEAYNVFLGNVQNWLMSLHDPELASAYRELFNPSGGSHGG